MSDNSQNHGWQIATGRKRKPISRPVAEAQESAPRSRTSGVEPAASSPIISPPGLAALHSITEPLQPTTLPIGPSTAEQSHASYLSIPAKPSPKKSEKSSVSSSPEKDYLTAPQSPNEGLTGSDVLGHEGSPTEEAYLSATEQPEEAFSNVEHPQASTEEVHQQSPSPANYRTESKGKERETDKKRAEESTGDPPSSTAESLSQSPDFNTRFLTFPAPVFEGGEESPEIDITNEIREQPTNTRDTEATHRAAPIKTAEDQTYDKHKEKTLRLKKTSEYNPDETAQIVPVSAVAERQQEQAQKWQEKEKDTTGATSTVDDSVTHIGRSILVPNMPRVVGRESGSQGDAESELLTKKAMMDMPLSYQYLTPRVHSAPRATMTQRRPTTSLSAEAAEFVPMPTIPEVSTSTTPDPPAEQTTPGLPITAPEIAPELHGFAAYDEQRIRAMAASHPANAATQFLAAPALHRPVTPVPPHLPLLPPPPPPSGESPLEVYDNETPGVPSHWIPLYGSVHGMFYDPLTKLFMGDGTPRPTLHRADGTTPCPPDPDAEADQAAFPIGNPEDVLHVQRSSFTAPHIGQPYVPAHTRFFCSCTGRWTASPHPCPPDTSTIPAGAAAPIRPDTVLPAGWVTHTAPIRDTSYLEAMGLAARPDDQIDSAVQQSWFEAGGGAAAVRGGPDTPVHPSRPLTSADLAAEMPTHQAHQPPAVAPAAVTTDEGSTARAFGAGATVSRQQRRAAEKAAEKAAKQAAARGGGRGRQGGSRGGGRGGGAGAGGGQGIAAV